MTVTLETFFHMNKLQIKKPFHIAQKTKYSCHLISWKLTLTNTQTDRAMDI